MEGCEAENAVVHSLDTFNLLQIHHKSGDHYARLPGSSNWHRYSIELTPSCLKYSRTYRPSLFASKLTESGELLLKDMAPPRWKNVASRQERSHCFYVGVHADRKFYMQARDHKDLLHWIRILEGNLVHSYCSLQLSLSAPHRRAFPGWRLNQSVLHHLGSMSLVQLPDDDSPAALSMCVPAHGAEAELQSVFDDDDQAIDSPMTTARKQTAADALASGCVLIVISDALLFEACTEDVCFRQIVRLSTARGARFKGQVKRVNISPPPPLHRCLVDTSLEVVDDDGVCWSIRTPDAASTQIVKSQIERILADSGAFDSADLESSRLSLVGSVGVELEVTTHWGQPSAVTDWLQQADSEGLSAQATELETKLAAAIDSKSVRNVRDSLAQEAAAQCAKASHPAEQSEFNGWSPLGWRWYDGSQAWKLQSEATYSRLINSTCEHPAAISGSVCTLERFLRKEDPDGSKPGRRLVRFDVRARHPCSVLPDQKKANVEQVYRDMPRTRPAEPRMHLNHDCGVFKDLSQLLPLIIRIFQIVQPWPITNGHLGTAPADSSPGLRANYGILWILTRLLMAFQQLYPSIGYMQGMAPVAATLLLHMPEEQAFWTFAATYTQILKGIVTESNMTFGLDAFKAQVRCCLKLVKPQLVEHMESVGDPSLLQTALDMYVIQMGLGLFVDLEQVPTDFLHWMFTQVFCTSKHMLFAACVAVFICAEDNLMQATELMGLMHAMRTALNSLDDTKFGALALEVAGLLQDGAPHLVHFALADAEAEITPREQQQEKLKETVAQMNEDIKSLQRAMQQHGNCNAGPTLSTSVSVLLSLIGLPGNRLRDVELRISDHQSRESLTTGEADLGGLNVIGGIFDKVANKVKQVVLRRHANEEVEVPPGRLSEPLLTGRISEPLLRIRRNSEDGIQKVERKKSQDLSESQEQEQGAAPIRKRQRPRANSTDSPRVGLSTKSPVGSRSLLRSLSVLSEGEPLAVLEAANSDPKAQAELVDDMQQAEGVALGKSLQTGEQSAAEGVAPNALARVPSNESDHGDETPDEMNARFTRSAMLLALEQQQQLMVEKDRQENELLELAAVLKVLSARRCFFQERREKLERCKDAGCDWIVAEWLQGTSLRLNTYMMESVRNHDLDAIKLLLQYVARLDECVDTNTELTCLETLLDRGPWVEGPVHDIEKSSWYQAGICMIQARGEDGMPFDFNKPIAASFGSGCMLHLLLRNSITPQRDALCTQLLSARADPLQQDLAGVSAMHMAASEGSISLVSAMMSTAQEGGQLATALQHKTLLGMTVLHLAAAGIDSDGYSRAHGCESLIMCSANVNAVSAAGETPLHMAARWGDHQVCKLLIESGAVVNAEMNVSKAAPLHLALQSVSNFRQAPGTVEWYRGAQDAPGIQCCIQLLQLRADPVATTTAGWSPLMIALRKGCFELADLLMRLDVEREFVSHSLTGGWNALHLSVLSGNSMLCQTLLEAKVDPNREAVISVLDGVVTSLNAKVLATMLDCDGDCWKGVTAVLQDKVNPDDAVAVKDEKATKAFDLLANSGFGTRRVRNTG